MGASDQRENIYHAKIGVFPGIVKQTRRVDYECGKRMNDCEK
jgi:hypothetical protein